MTEDTQRTADKTFHCLTPFGLMFWIQVCYQLETICMLGNISAFCCRRDFSKIQKNISVGIALSEFLTVWIQIRTDVWSFLIWVQTFCKRYKQTLCSAFSSSRSPGLVCDCDISLSYSLVFCMNMSLCQCARYLHCN